MNIRTPLLLAGAACAALGLSACDNGPSAVQTRDRFEAAAPSYETASVGSAARADDAAGLAGGFSGGRARNPGRQAAQAQGEDELGGGLVWAANSRHTAQDNAQYQFDKRAADFGVTDFKAFVSRADAFVAHPPQGVLKMERSNGDVLLYDPKSNVFAVADRSGAPRTMLKPSDGMAYWDAQKAREARRNDRAGDDGEKS
jgi:pyocin large subunit-like protein